MATSRDVYSVDDNFLIGDDHLTDRLRREARQLHLSKFSRTRREAHFARYRNSFLKCDLEQTNDRIEQGRKLRLAELERSHAALMKQKKGRKKIRRESRDLFMEKKTKGNPINTGYGDKNMDVQDEKRRSGFTIISPSRSRGPSVGENHKKEERHDHLTSVTKPALQVTSAMSSRDDRRSSDERKVSVNEHAKQTKNPSDIVLAESRENKRGVHGIQGCNGIRQNKRLSAANSRSSWSSELAGARNKNRNSSVEVSSPAQASSVAGDYIVLGNHDKMPTVAGKQEIQLTVASMNLSRASSVAGKRHLRAKQDKTPSRIPSRMSPVTGKDELLGTQEEQVSGKVSRVSSEAGKQSAARKHVHATSTMPKLLVTGSIATSTYRRNSFGSNLVEIEKADEQRKNSLASSAKSLSDFGLSRAEKTAETHHENESAGGAKELKSRIYSAALSEASLEATSRISRTSRSTVTSALTELQEASTNNLNAQTRSAHERWIWREFDKIMKGFSNILQIEHKSVNLKNTNTKSEGVVEKDTKPPNTQHNPMTPLYFRFGISDRIVFRC